MPRLVVIVGGFMIVAGIMLLGVAALAVFGYLNVGMLLERKFLLMLAILMIVVGLMDAFSAIIVARW